MPVKIISYNLNGIRAAMSKGLLDWLAAASPDIFCIQETKAHPEQLNLEDFNALGYHTYWHSAEKKGYSGVAIFSKIPPLNVETGCGIPQYDREGRFLRVDFKDFSLLNTYFPSGTSGDDRQAFKYRFLDDFYAYIQELKQTIPNLVITGDVNICHQPIDIHNPISNKNSTGFLPEERAWVGKFLEGGFIDSFRSVNPEPHQYTWWSYRFNSRAQNKGWRIDYQFVSEGLRPHILKAAILSDAFHSDHCPTYLELDI